MALSPVSNTEPCEEWRIDLYENFKGFEVAEYENIERLCAIAKAIKEYGSSFALYLDYFNEDDINIALEKFEERYHGCYCSVLDYVENYYQSSGLLDSIENAGLSRDYIDWDAIVLDYECSGNFLFLQDQEYYELIYVFSTR